MKFDFTEGEWVVNYDTYISVECKNKHICIIRAVMPIDKLSEKKANAHLIACAPEMLEALIEDSKFFEKNIFLLKNNLSESYFDRCLERQNFNINIIEKATGKTWEEINKE